ncbi:TIM-barrel domain-containing protein [Saliterribacillus persicus]|uniref:Alpha-D-xyloside xylohydrolase n=1 Tax=Saliterribacillus persicus TaxID=930114 RepID=A0A368XBA0_9BACI|nr:TIM-barrel domain-containing protein [Saliterribacillus persicus]RCW64278.1 alpha-D-xyloside xylohydrolase [Saliterribacillus persicus]
MQIVTYEKLNNQLLIKCKTGLMKIIPYTDSIIRIRYTLENEFNEKESLFVEPNTQQNIPYSVNESDDIIVFSTSNVQIHINKNTAAFTYKDDAGRILTKEPTRGGKTLTPTEVLKPVYDQNTEIENSQNVDGARAKAVPTNHIVDRMAYHTKLEFEWDNEEALYGLGSHEEGVLNLRGTHQYLYQQNMKSVVPVLVSTNGYGIIVDSYSLIKFHDDIHGSYIWTDVDSEMDYYFVYGPDFDQIVKSYRYLTGKAPLLPKWAFGYVQSKERYKSQEELISIVKEYRKRRIPLDLIVLDWRSWTGELWGQKSFDPERFPNPTAMMEEIHKLNAKLMISIWPIMNNDGPNHVEMKQKGYLLGNQANYDAFNEEARNLYWKQANEGLFSHGVDAWWCDCTEPFEADWVGKVKPEPEERMFINTQEAKKYLDPEYINAYSLLHSKGLYENQRKTTESKRVVNLTRSSYAGQQKYSAVTWSGDIAANWKTLQNQIADGLNMCVTGIPYWTLDIGAFFVADREQWFWDGDYPDGCDDLGYRELYVRWLQYGVFLPMFRSHGADTPREVWRFGEEGTIFYDTLVKYINLRYRLLPYIYSIAGWVTNDDYTMMRTLAFDFRNDPHTFDVKDQYMFGPSFLVNPVTEPMYYESGSEEMKGSVKKRSVYLPVDTQWYDFWTNQRFEGGQVIEANADLKTMPLFVRAGSIVPVGPAIQYTSEDTNEPLEILIYKGEDGSFLLYDDEGDTYNYEKGAFFTIQLRWEDKNNRFTIGDRIGSYPGMKTSMEFALTIINDAEDNVAQRIITYTGEQTTIHF